MDQTATMWTGGYRPPVAGIGRWLHIRRRALRVRRIARRQRPEEWLAGASPWAFWGLHR